MKTIFSFLILSLVIRIAYPQGDQYMYSKEVTRAIDLREKQNEPLMAQGRELTKLLIEATRNGHLTAYYNDSLRISDTMSINSFLENITLTEGQTEEDCDCENEDDLLDFCECDDNEIYTEYFFASDLYQIEITEDVLFDKEKSIMVTKIKSLSLFIPADHPENVKAIQELVAVYDFDELTKLWNTTADALWINPHNDQGHKSLTDAFEMRLFSSYIIKIANPKDEFIYEIHQDPYTALIESQNAAMDLAEYESNLWEN